ncbi:hypothetical protein [Nonomuraea glycinis]|uniref:hypothetical protein n=1 Tax=Nonomuraea glycinis TaxID=2047744 RepID=UPI0033B9E851
MTSLQKLPDRQVVPRLVGGLRSLDFVVTIPERHARHLAQWASDHGITEHADVVCTSLIATPEGGSSRSGPLQRFTTDELRQMRTHLSSEIMLGGVRGWNLDIITGEEQIRLTLLDDGTITEQRRTAFSEPRPGTRTPAERVRDAANRELQTRIDHETARVARDVVIRAELAGSLSIQMAAELAGLGEPRVYQIRDERR